MTFYLFYLLRREMAAFVILRQDFLMSKDHSATAQSKTVLVTGVPKEYLTVDSFTRFASAALPGKITRVWLARDLKELPDLYDRRAKACKKLESAETSLLKKAAKAIVKLNKKDNKAAKKAKEPAPTGERDVSDISVYVPDKDRPKHKLGFLGLLGEKVDTIEWAKKEIAETNKLIHDDRVVLHGKDGHEKYPTESAVFVQFERQLAAHMFAQCLAHHAPLRMSARHIEVGADAVIWSNLTVTPYQAKGRYAISWAATIGLIILWAFPVAFVGLLSNVSKLCVQYSWLAWLCKLPTPVNGIIQGALPPIALAVLFLLLPIVLRLLARFEGIPLKTLIELSLMTRYFMFLVIHGFLIVTLASGLLPEIKNIYSNPSSIVTTLATQLPSASTFFLTYFVTVSIASSMGGLLQIVGLILYYVKLFVLASTPRSVYGIKHDMPNVAWGTLFPNMTLLTVIGITYSIIAPLVAGFACLAFALFYFTNKYLFIWVRDMPKAGETGGMFYPKALSHIFVGMYIQQICLTGLFFLYKDSAGKQGAIPEGALMVVLIVITAAFQIVMRQGYSPLFQYLPLSVGGKLDELSHQPNATSTSDDTPLINSNATAATGEKATYPPSANGGEKGQTAVDMPEEEDEVLDKNAFNHPAAYEGYPTIWVPVDHHGFFRREIEGIKEAGVEVSTDGAVMDVKGHVDVTRAPPGEEWDPSQSI